MPGEATQYILALDNGTQSVRAILFDSSGALIAKSKIEIEPYTSPHLGWAVQDATYFWDRLCQACQALWAETDIPRAQIKAVSVTTQRATGVPVDRSGQPLLPAITWLDQRRVETEPDLRWWEKGAMRLIGATGAVREFHQKTPANWIAQNEPERWAEMHKYLLLSGYHIHRLTGQFRDAVASQVGYIPFEYKRLDWARPGAWQWRTAPIDRAHLPDLVLAGQVLGTITAQAAEETGIPEGVPLISSGSDKACEVLGSGCVDVSLGALSYGTIATFNLVTERYVEALPPYPAYPGLIPGTFNAEVSVPRGYWMVSWFKREFGLREEQLAAERGVATEALFDELLRAVPPGAHGLTLQPYWAGRSGKDGADARGAIIGFGDGHTRAHLYRAIIEGLTYALRDGLEALERKTGKTVKALRVSGGGSQSDAILQITADVFGLPAERPHTYETSALGAAMAAAVGVGLYPDFQQAAAHMTRRADRFLPNPEHHEIYDRIYRRVYRKIYGRLRPSYAELRRIIG